MTITPEEARDLVASFEGRRLAAEYETYGLADGYHHIEHYVLLEIDGEHPETGEPDVWTDTLGMPDKATANMISAAPVMAAQIANMKWEYAAQLRDGNGEWQNYTGVWYAPNGDYQMRLLPPNCARGWTEDRPEAYELWDDLELYERRIVRRLVSEPEEID